MSVQRERLRERLRSNPHDLKVHTENSHPTLIGKGGAFTCRDGNPHPNWKIHPKGGNLPLVIGELARRAWVGGPVDLRVGRVGFCS